MNRKEILNEILKNFPELGKDKKALNKAINFLLEKNPKVSIDKDFEKNLKKRLKAIIDLKSEKSKGKIWNILIPSFTLLFFVFGLSYFYSDINIFNKKNIKNNENTGSIQSRNILKGSPEIYGSMQKTNMLQNENSDTYMMKTPHNSTILGGGSPNNLNYEDNDLVDDTHIIDSLDNLNFTKKIETFEEYCKNLSGQFIEKDNKKSCKLKEKYCSERDYINGKCNFKRDEN